MVLLFFDATICVDGASNPDEVGMSGLLGADKIDSEMMIFPFPIKAICASRRASGVASGHFSVLAI